MNLQDLLEEHGPLVSRLTYALGGDHAAAEDLAQETLLRAWQRLPAGLVPEQRRAWVNRTSQNLAVDELRRRTRRGSIPLEDAGQIPDPRRGDLSDSEPARAALAQLSPHERFVLLLRLDGGFSHAEIGQLLGIGEEAARKRVTRARQTFLRGYRAERAASDPLVLLVTRDDDPQPYVDWLRRHGAQIRRAGRDLRERDLATADAVVFTGAVVDLDARLYGEQPREPQDALDLARDQRDLRALTTALAMDLPVLGICLGGQLLNIASGGTLYQDVVSEGATATPHNVSDHLVHTSSGTMARHLLGRRAGVRSTHHQAVRRLGRRLHVTATSPDGVVETIERDDKPFAVGTQWHPELSDEPVSRSMAEALIHAARAVA